MPGFRFGLSRRQSRPYYFSPLRLMNKLTLSPLLVATVAAAVCAHPNEASAQGTVTFTNATLFSVSGINNFLFALSPGIQNADELLSINEGTLTGGESASFNLSVQYANSSTQPIYSQSWSGFGPGYALNTMPAESFTLGNITGLIFGLANTGFGTPQLTIPAGTVFTFDVVPVPEPAAGALLGLGAIGIWGFTRRKTS
ncbi:MAG TPA: PEP-CTERM sorting domain-containing protein [Candidatus Acidoferrales bacterium]|nr:PEP-CTERM sorting domain-containing protein [Candidatus Acidoferrales bacterium]